MDQHPWFLNELARDCHYREGGGAGSRSAEPRVRLIGVVLAPWFACSSNVASGPDSKPKYLQDADMMITD